MIITGGMHKGRKVKTVKSKDVRPTASKVRESIFNILQSKIENAVMLDLFAGSGIMGIEALSRGAKKVVFVEKNHKVIKNLRENLFNFNFDYEIISCDSVIALEKFIKNKFDVIFIDPPYASCLIELVLSRIKENDILQDKGIIIIEHNSNYKISDVIDGFSIYKEKKYGDTSVTLIIKDTL